MSVRNMVVERKNGGTIYLSACSSGAPNTSIRDGNTLGYKECEQSLLCKLEGIDGNQTLSSIRHRSIEQKCLPDSPSYYFLYKGLPVTKQL